MKKSISIVVTVALLSGCATTPTFNVIRETVDTGRIQGMDKGTKFRYAFGFPNATSGIHPGPYQSLDNVNVKVETGEYEGKNTTFLLGQTRKTGKWEVFGVMVEEDGNWHLIPIQPKKE